MPLTGKTVAILIEEGFRNAELEQPLLAMKYSGAEIMTIGSGSKEFYASEEGDLTMIASGHGDQVEVLDFDAIIIPGGDAPERMIFSESLVKLVKKAYESGKLIAAIGHGPLLLSAADIVNARRVTSAVSAQTELETAGAIWLDESLVKDGNIITARGVDALPQFNDTIFEALQER
jgi:protease I